MAFNRLGESQASKSGKGGKLKRIEPTVGSIYYGVGWRGEDLAPWIISFEYKGSVEGTPRKYFFRQIGCSTDVSIEERDLRQLHDLEDLRKFAAIL